MACSFHAVLALAVWKEDLMARAPAYMLDPEEKVYTGREGATSCLLLPAGLGEVETHCVPLVFPAEFALDQFPSHFSLHLKDYGSVLYGQTMDRHGVTASCHSSQPKWVQHQFKS